MLQFQSLTGLDIFACSAALKMRLLFRVPSCSVVIKVGNLMWMSTLYPLARYFQSSWHERISFDYWDVPGKFSVSSWCCEYSCTMSTSAPVAVSAGFFGYNPQRWVHHSSWMIPKLCSLCVLHPALPALSPGRMIREFRVNRARSQQAPEGRGKEELWFTCVPQQGK